MIRDDLTTSLRGALDAADLPVPPDGIEIEPARSREHGDWSTNLALQLAGPAGRAPRELATEIAQHVRADPPRHVTRVEVAGPGFVNFHLDDTWLHDVLAEVVAAGSHYGRGRRLAGHRVNLEFVSANPTGPLHAGGGRWVAVGDAIANVLAWQGAEVHREYYLNDAGTQLDSFGASLLARARGEEPPDDGYHGPYVQELAERMVAELGTADVDLVTAREWGYRAIVAGLEADLGRIGVHFDTWFSERLLHERGDVDDVLRTLRVAGETYEADGATWLRTTDHGDQRDRVLVRSDGTPTYLAADLAYHRDKLRRGFDHLVDIWGADHHGQVPSIRAGMAALGAPDEPEVLLGQLVRLERGGETVRLSKRSGDVITLSDILDEVDPDAARLTFLLQSIDTAQTFDLDVVTDQSMENPVYYVQYAHARIASIGRKAAAEGIERRPLADVDLTPLREERELELLRSLYSFPDVAEDAAAARAPYKVTNWVRELAGRFHRFYAECRVVTDDDGLTQARLWLAEATRIGLASGMGLLGVEAPDAMARLEEAAS